jgi:hypothetical protein
VIIAALVGNARAQDAKEKPASLDGSVVNSVTGEPILRAHVTLRHLSAQGQKLYGALTGPDGKFSVTTMPAGTYMVTAERTGFAARPGDQSQFKLSPGEAKAEVKLKLVPTGSITGRVLDSEGEPIESVMVSAIMDGNTFSSSTTDEKGSFRLGGLIPEKYRLRAKPAPPPFPPDVRSDGTAEVHYRGTYYPNLPNESGAGRIEVTPGTDTPGIDIRLLRGPIVKVSGVVVGMPPKSENIAVMVNDTNSTDWGEMVKSDGKFQIWRLDPGRYRLRAEQFSNGRTPLQSAPVEIEVGEVNIDHVELRLIPAFDMQGQIEYDDEQAKPPALPSSPQPNDSRAAPRQLYVQNLEGGFGIDGATIGADGTFSLKSMEPDIYRVRPSWDGVYVKSMLVGQTLVDGSILDVSNGAAGQTLSVRLSSAVAQLSGTVRNGDTPAAGVQVVLVQNGPGRFGFDTVVNADASGHYIFPAVPPGKYRVLAAQTSVDSIIVNGKLSEEYEGQGEALEIAPKDQVTRDLKVH